MAKRISDPEEILRLIDDFDCDGSDCSDDDFAGYTVKVMLLTTTVVYK